MGMQEPCPLCGVVEWAHGIKYEQERIIKLLEEYKDGDLLFAQNLNTPSKDVAYTMFKGDVIALIKEEK